MNAPNMNFSCRRCHPKHFPGQRFRYFLCFALLTLVGGSLGGGASKTLGQFGGINSPESSQAEMNRTGEGQRPKVLQIILREGTQVGPIRGRFVLRGHRWMLLIEDEQSDPAKLSQMIDGGVARKVAEESGSVLGRNRAGNDLSGNASGTNSSEQLPAFDDGSIGRVNPFVDRSQSSLRAAAFEQMVLLENLMLGRIASAIEQDPDDDVWTITGRVTEFQDENRLLLLTAHRAPQATSR